MDSGLRIDQRKVFRPHCNKDLPIIQLIKNRFEEELNYRTYCLSDKSSNYVVEVPQSVDKWAKSLQVQMKMQIFDSFDPVSILSFLSAFKLACDTSGVNEGAALWLIGFL